MSSITAVPLRPIAKGSLTKLWLGIALLVIAAAALAWFGTKAHAANKDGTTAQFLAWNAQQDGVITTASGLQYQVLAPGSGPTPTDEDVATVGYKGELRDGSVFDQQPRAPLRRCACSPCNDTDCRPGRRGFDPRWDADDAPAG